MTINESNAWHYDTGITMTVIYKVDSEKFGPQSLLSYSNNLNSIDKDSRGKTKFSVKFISNDHVNKKIIPARWGI